MKTITLRIAATGMVTFGGHTLKGIKCKDILQKIAAPLGEVTNVKHGKGYYEEDVVNHTSVDVSRKGG